MLVSYIPFPMHRITIFVFISLASLIVVYPFRFTVQSYGVEGFIRVPDDYATIQGAVDAANPGDTILVSAGTYYENLTINKSLALFGEDPNTTIIHGNGAWYVVKVTADDVTIGKFTIRNGSYVGIWLIGACNNSIIDNKIRDNRNSYPYYFPTGIGFMLTASNSNRISRNLLKDNWMVGFEIQGSHDNIIEHCVIEETSYPGPTLAGITMFSSDNNSFLHNTVNGHFSSSIRIEERSFYNRFVGNTLYSSSIITANNIFYRNNFIYPNGSVSGNNTWDNGAEGNYWSDYSGVDSDGDGIGDTPYELDPKNIDHYPLMGPWSETRTFPILWDETTYNVTTCCNSTVASFHFNQPSKYIGFNVTGPADSVGLCNITIPTSLMWGQFSVLINDIPQPFAIHQNQTHTSIYFVYSHTTHQVKVHSTQVIPEFPSLVILSLFLMATLLVTILHRIIPTF